ncbi:MAG: cobalamin-binding protein [Burkholderiales bacterium]
MKLLRAALALLCAVCTAAMAAPVQVVDDAGATVALPQPARRIVSLAPHATELLYAAGGGGALVGAVAHSDWPPAARSVPRVGDAGALDLERIVALKPDLVLAWPYTVPAQLAALQAQRIAVFVSSPATIAGIAADVERLGTLAGTQDVARGVARSLREREAALAARYRDRPRLRVFYEIWNEPMFTIGGRHLISEAIALCGGENVFGALTMPAPSVTVEAVIAAAPDVIVGGDDAGRRPAWLDDWKRWPAIPAVRDGNLFGAAGDLMHRPGPRFLDGVAVMCEDFDAARRKRAGVRQ